MAPKRSRPYMPDYRISTGAAGLLPWSFVEDRMNASRNYWITSMRTDGNPHAAPVWGLWYEGGFYFSTGEESAKGKNIKLNPNVSVHLESGDEVVILEGQLTNVTDQEVLKGLDEKYEKKYGLKMQGPGAIFYLQIKKAFAWREKDFPKSATRWIFD
jgi:general stress protein 26